MWHTRVFQQLLKGEGRRKQVNPARFKLRKFSEHIDLHGRDPRLPEHTQQTRQSDGAFVANDPRPGCACEFRRFIKGIFDVSELVDELGRVGIGPAQDPAVRDAYLRAYRDDVVRLAEGFPAIDLRLWPNFADLA